jgi:hypothetical protein
LSPQAVILSVRFSTAGTKGAFSISNEIQR